MLPPEIDLSDDTANEPMPCKSAVERILHSIPKKITDVNGAMPFVVRACYETALSEFELAQVVDELCKKFDQPGKKTALARTLKREVKIYRERVFQRKSIEFGSIQINQPVPRDSFPDSFINDTGALMLSATVNNLEHLLNAYGVLIEYDVVLKNEVLVFPPGTIGGESDLAAEAAVQMIRSLANLSGLSAATVDFLPILLDRRPKNHVVDWIKEAEHDGADHITQLAGTITVPAGLSDVWPKILKMWLIQCVAAADGAENTPRRDALPKFESMLVLVGGQGLTKTSWLGSLVPADLKKYFADGLHLKVGNRDSEKIAVSCWIAEFGELDATFLKSAVSLLKAFLSRQIDTMRLSYAKRECSFKRRTSFAASVNSHRFLADTTGNRRFIPVEVLAVNAKHGINLQQLWRQVWDLYLVGAQWWPDAEIELELKKIQAAHTEICPVQDALMTVFNLDPAASADAGVGHWSCKQISNECGIEPSQKNFNRVGEILRVAGFELKTVGGKRGFYILKQQ